LGLHVLSARDARDILRGIRPSRPQRGRQGAGDLEPLRGWHGHCAHHGRLGIAAIAVRRRARAGVAIARRPHDEGGALMMNRVISKDGTSIAYERLGWCSKRRWRAPWVTSSPSTKCRTISAKPWLNS